MATLTTLTPVHIGNGITYTKNSDFVVRNGQVGIVDETKLLGLIGETKTGIDQWTKAIVDQRPILEFLEKDRGLKNVTLEQVSGRVCSLKTGGQQAMQLKEQYRTAMTGACIPGSSLKGCLKTAIWDSLTDTETLGRWRADDLKNRKGKWDDTTADQNLFGRTANDKSTRFLQVGDAQFGDLKTEIHEFKILNRQFRDWRYKDGQSALIETIPAGARANLSIKLNTTLLNRNRDKYPDIWPASKVAFVDKGTAAFCQLVNAFTLDLLQWELDELANEGLEDHNDGVAILDELDRVYKLAEACQPNEFVVRVGGHSGWKFTTGAWVRKEALNLSEVEFNNLRRTIQRNKDYDMKLWPKTRKVSPGGGVFGFVKLVL